MFFAYNPLSTEIDDVFRILLCNNSSKTRKSYLQLNFTARRYASAAYAMGLCPSVRLSVTSRCSIKKAKRRTKQTTSIA